MNFTFWVLQENGWPDKVWTQCPDFVQCLSRLCPEFVHYFSMSKLCPYLVHQNRFCPEFVWPLSSISPVFVQWNATSVNFVQTYGHWTQNGQCLDKICLGFVQTLSIKTSIKQYVQTLSNVCPCPNFVQSAIDRTMPRQMFVHTLVHTLSRVCPYFVHNDLLTHRSKVCPMFVHTLLG